MKDFAPRKTTAREPAQKKSTGAGLAPPSYGLSFIDTQVAQRKENHSTSPLPGGPGTVYQLFGFKEYFWGNNQQPALPVQAPVPAAQNPLPDNHSSARSSYMGWIDWAHQGARSGWDMLHSQAGDSQGAKTAKSAIGGGLAGAAIGSLGALGAIGGLPVLGTLAAGVGGIGALAGGLGAYFNTGAGSHGEKVEKAAQGGGGLVSGLLGGIGGGILGAAGSLAHTAHRGIAGAVDHSYNVLTQSDNDQDTLARENPNTQPGVAWNKFKSLGASTLGPIVRGLGSGFVGQGKDDQGHDRPSAASEIFTRMTEGSGGGTLAKIGAGIHAGIGGLAQTAIGGAVGTLKATKNVADFVAGKIGPGPISSLTGPIGAHQALEKSDDHASKAMGTVGSAGDTIGALAQVASGPMNMLTGLFNYAAADKSDAEKQYIATDNLKEQQFGGASNLVRGGGYLAADMSKGENASWLAQKAGLQNAVHPAMQHVSNSIYGAYHLWKAGHAAHDLMKFSGMASAAHADDRMQIGSAPPTDVDKFLVYARDNKKASLLRNTLAVGGVALGMAGMGTLAGAIGLGLGASQLWHWLSSKTEGSRSAHANWLVNQVVGLVPIPANIQPIADHVIPVDLMALLRTANPSADIIKKAKETVESRLASW